MKSVAKFAALLLVLLLGVAAVRVASRAQDKPEEKKKRSFFGGTKAVAGSGSQQAGVTATGGTKGLSGEEIGNVQPTAADRGLVVAMDNYAIPEPDLKQFQEDGKLIPAK